MSFDKMSKKELVEVAGQFAVEPTGTKAEILKSLEEEGVTWDLYRSLQGDGSNAEPVVKQADTVPDSGRGDGGEEQVILAYRGNGSQSVGRRVWSKNSPFAVVSQREAEQIINKHGWVFSLATPKEAEAFYA